MKEEKLSKIKKIAKNTLEAEARRKIKKLELMDKDIGEIFKSLKRASEKFDEHEGKYDDITLDIVESLQGITVVIEDLYEEIKEVQYRKYEKHVKQTAK